MKGSMSLIAGSVIPKTKSYAQKELAFEISTPSRTLLVHCDTIEEMRDWSRIIQQRAWDASLEKATTFKASTDPEFSEEQKGAALEQDQADQDGNHDASLAGSKAASAGLNADTKDGANNDAGDSDDDNTQPVDEPKNSNGDADMAISQDNSLDSNESDSEKTARKAEELRMSNSAKKLQRSYRNYAAAARQAKEKAASLAEQRRLEERAKAEAAAKAEAEAKAKAKAEAEAAQKADEARKLLEEKRAKEAAAKAEEEAQTKRLMGQLQHGAVFMKKRGDEVEYRNPRFVWCEMGKLQHKSSKGSDQASENDSHSDAFRICWSKGREKDTSHYKFALGRDFTGVSIGSVNGGGGGQDNGEDNGGAGAAGASVASGASKGPKQKRASIFSVMHDMHSERVEMITPDACFSLVHAADARQNIDLHLEKSASRSRVANGVAKRRDAWVDAFRAFLDMAKA